MKLVNNLYIVLLTALLLSCNTNEKTPEDNNFSYLDSASTPQTSASEKNESDSSAVYETLTCEKKQAELIGVVNEREYPGPPGYGKTPSKDILRSYYILKLQTPVSVSCNNEQSIKTDEVLLLIAPDYPVDHLMGGTVLAIGQLGKTEEKRPYFPLEMQVLRIDAAKASIQ